MIRVNLPVTASTGAVEVAAAAKVPTSTTQQLHRRHGANGSRLFIGKRNPVPPPESREAFLLNQILKPLLATLLALLDADIPKRTYGLVNSYITRVEVSVPEGHTPTTTLNLTQSLLSRHFDAVDLALRDRNRQPSVENRKLRTEPVRLSQ